MTDLRPIVAPAASRTGAIPNLRRGALLAMASALALTMGTQDAWANGGAGRGGTSNGLGGPAPAEPVAAA